MIKNLDFMPQIEDESTFYIKEVQSVLKEVLGVDTQIEFDGSTYEVDEDNFRLTFNIEDDYLTILNIEIIDEGQGLGRKIVEALHEFAEMNELEVRATKVKPEAIGFWEKLGYQKGSEEGEYFLALF